MKTSLKRLDKIGAELLGSGLFKFKGPYLLGLVGTNYNFLYYISKDAGWYFVAPHSEGHLSMFRYKEMRDYSVPEYSPVSFDDVFEAVNYDIKYNIICHLNLFRGF